MTLTFFYLLNNLWGLWVLSRSIYIRQCTDASSSLFRYPLFVTQRLTQFQVEAFQLGLGFFWLVTDVHPGKQSFHNGSR